MPRHVLKHGRPDQRRAPHIAHDLLPRGSRRAFVPRGWYSVTSVETFPARVTAPEMIGTSHHPEEDTVRKWFMCVADSPVIVAAGVLAGGAGAAKPRTFRFTETITGAQISGTEAVFKVHDSRIGRGAGDQLVKVSGLGGTDTETTYYGDASAKSNGSFKLGAPDSNGISQLTGKGHDTSGTGKLKGFKSTYSYTGTFNTKTLAFTVVLKGTGSTT